MRGPAAAGAAAASEDCCTDQMKGNRARVGGAAAVLRMMTVTSRGYAGEQQGVCRRVGATAAG